MKDGQTIGQWLNWDFEANGDLEIRNKDGKLIYWDNDGYWQKWEYDSQGNEIYAEEAHGAIRDNRPKTCEGKVVEIEGVKYKLTKV